MMNDFDELYWHVYNDIADNRDNRNDTNSLLAALKDIRLQHYRDVIEKDIEFLLYKGYSKQEITDELTHLYRQNLNQRQIQNAIDSIIGND